MSTPYENIETTSPVFSGPLLLTYPLHQYGVGDHVVAYQDYYIRPGSYVAPTMASTITIGAATAYLVGDSEPVNDVGGVARFTRAWATVPASWKDYGSYVATYPGIIFERESFQRQVTAEMQHEYFLCMEGQTYATPGDVPIVSATGYTYTGDALPRPPEGFLLNDGGGDLSPSTPSLTNYFASVTAAEYTIVAEDSTLSRYLGDIWVRTTKRVKPQ